MKVATMGKRIFTSVAIVGSLVLVAVVTLVVWFAVFSESMGQGGSSIGETSVQYVSINPDRRISLLVWSDLTDGPIGQGGESALFGSTICKGFASSADGRRIDWEWKEPKAKGGDFQINRTPYDLANGTLFLVSTRGGKVRVTQVDVDLSKVQSDKQGFEAFAKNEPTVARFIAESSGQK
jgi:hypothetical protein